MRTKYFFILLLLSFASRVSAQSVKQSNGGSFVNSHAGVSDEISPQQRAQIIKMLQANEKVLREKGMLSLPSQPAVTGFQWPVSQPAGFNDNGFYGISNYVDEDPSTAILDYNCNNRTYDGHKGTDIFNWPFPWQKMALNAVQIIAAAPGTIIGKSDGFTDTSCAVCSSCNWNAVYIMQADGSIAWYGHMKINSQTPKAVGQAVALGEYLGIVGSSGNSTGPHLHFEVYTNNTYSQLVDPWAGTCNALNGLTSWWANQQPNYVSTLNKIMTHNLPPAMPGCKSGEVVNASGNFVNGQTVYLASYYRDQQAGQQATHTIYIPDNTVYSSWTQNFTTYYSASYWYYSIVLSSPAPTGMWRYEVAYNGQPPLSTYFAVNTMGYTFTGNGNWDIATNWNNNAVPPAVLPAGNEIIINPVAGGECILNSPQTISSTAKITVISGKSFRVLGNLVVQ
ncbi:MAG TPA: peptidoglycan DD-metalloendopeptidase family protein [Chitinophagaceae bacterium]|nr:peptidoglycan DD-metalloendopeptidase family protein [Chitinophagaceae bacterium]